MNTLSTVGITMGDGAGVGPEIIVKALGDRELRATVRLVVIGDAVRLNLDPPIEGELGSAR